VVLDHGSWHAEPPNITSSSANAVSVVEWAGTRLLRPELE
jgi:hypothetical protein